MNLLREFLSIMRRIHAICRQRVKKRSEDTQLNSILGRTKTHDTQLNLFDINGALSSRCCHGDISSVLDPLTRWFPKGVLKQEPWRIQVTTFFGSNNFGHIKAMELIFFFQIMKILCRFQKISKISRKRSCFWR